MQPALLSTARLDEAPQGAGGEGPSSAAPAPAILVSTNANADLLGTNVAGRQAGALRDLRSGNPQRMVSAITGAVR